jgi:hypothetical protein
MSDETTVTTLIFIGAICQIIIAVLFLLGGIGSSIGTAVGFIFGGFSDPFDLIWVFIPGVPMIVFGILGLLFGTYWLRWRHTPAEYKQKLIMTGIIALIFTGVVPGLLTLIGGAIIPNESA